MHLFASSSPFDASLFFEASVLLFAVPGPSGAAPALAGLIEDHPRERRGVAGRAMVVAAGVADVPAAAK